MRNLLKAIQSNPLISNEPTIPVKCKWNADKCLPDPFHIYDGMHFLCIKGGNGWSKDCIYIYRKQYDCYEELIPDEGNTIYIIKEGQLYTYENREWVKGVNW